MTESKRSFFTLVLLCTYKYGKDLTLQIKELIKRARYNFESLWREGILFINIHWPNKVIDNWYRNHTNGSLFNTLSHIKFKNSFKSVNLTFCLATKNSSYWGDTVTFISQEITELCTFWVYALLFMMLEQRSLGFSSCKINLVTSFRRISRVYLM